MAPGEEDHHLEGRHLELHNRRRRRCCCWRTVGHDAMGEVVLPDELATLVLLLVELFNLKKEVEGKRKLRKEVS